MSLLHSKPSMLLWQELIKSAESRADISLDEELEVYLITLLMRYIDKPELAQQVLANSFLQAYKTKQAVRNISLQHVGDQCLLYAGLFPHIAEKKHVKISYFIDLGRSAYGAVSKNSQDLYWSLACRFVLMTDVLQSIPENSTLLPLEAYDQWNEIGSQRALKILQNYTHAVPIKNIRR